MKLAKLLFLASPLVVLASAADYRVTLYEKSVLGGTELAPGEYKVEINGDMAKIYSKKQSVEAHVKMESNGEKYNTTSVRYANGDGKYRVQEIRLGGTNTKLTFDN